MAPSSQPDQNPDFWAPGTVIIADRDELINGAILHPTPTDDPNDPLNWSALRKAVNFALVSLYVLLTFVQLDIGFTAWEQMQGELRFSVDQLNGSAAVNYAGLAVGCILFIPFAYKYGRRPVYLFSALLQFVGCIWFATTKNIGDSYGSNLISGLGGAISETIAQMTIADLFFVHDHASMNGWYLFSTFTGAYLGPVASGYIVESQGWRWMWWWCVILFGINLVLILLFFEETKFTRVLTGSHEVASDQGERNESTETSRDKQAQLQQVSSAVQLESPPRKKSYRERLAWVTKTDGSMLHDFYQPVVVLFTFPAVAYTAATFGTLLAWFAILVSTQSTYLFLPPYNFTAVGVGLMNLAPFVGALPGVFFGGYLNDKSIVWLAKRNNGIYEPEMRLWIALPMAIITPAGILTFGLGLNSGASWPVLAVGLGMFAFGLTVASDVALSYSMDCYHDIVGTALVGVVFVRNVLAVVVLFALTPWTKAMGLQGLHIFISVVCFVVLLLPAVLLVWGKKGRVATRNAYMKMSQQQPTGRDFS
ncbi:MFS domain-containing protein [Fusarium keratoplasticum]|uniref:MFS domain-containing protein n=1 Tax=Fusarium keratoplasticum TaxID=1328300 RepID=A0ACC0QD48_9HYPO|nr:MFS domain-containing protein [Fusarium keratoplasticum]KAI8650814.1 MFS domain-containing protein [Fusarium keratoplasticum]KAI8651605.1 MFS domain-containing protein [Fusarium keratoplasticum]